jgi:hypothetical protein
LAGADAAAPASGGQSPGSRVGRTAACLVFFLAIVHAPSDTAGEVGISADRASKV